MVIFEKENKMTHILKEIECLVAKEKILQNVQVSTDGYFNSMGLSGIRNNTRWIVAMKLISEQKIQFNLSKGNYMVKVDDVICLAKGNQNNYAFVVSTFDFEELKKALMSISLDEEIQPTDEIKKLNHYIKLHPEILARYVETCKNESRRRRLKEKEQNKK